MVEAMASERVHPVAELRRTALETLARLGVKGMTVQAVADAAGCTKSNVLYHFGSKTALVTAALEPALARLAEVATALEAGAGNAASAAQSLEAVDLLVDLIVERRLATYVVLHYFGELPDEVLTSLLTSSERLSSVLNAWQQDARSRLRMHIVLGGVAFVLAGPFSSHHLPGNTTSDAELLAQLRPLVAELLQAER